MGLSLLFPNSKKWRAMKRMALQEIEKESFEQNEMRTGGSDSLENKFLEDKDYIKILKSYRRVKHDMEIGKIYDFYCLKKRLMKKHYPLSKFNRFKLVGMLKICEPYYIFEDGDYKLVSNNISRKTCPFCNADVAEEEIAEHLIEELDDRRGKTEGGITVLFEEGAFGGYERLNVNCTSVRELKKAIYDKTGISTSKQEICKEGVVLKGSDVIRNETVLLRQKHKENIF